jgi:hypothetical protein
VLCPIDLSDNSTHAIEQPRAAAGWYKARLIVLHADVPGSVAECVISRAGCWFEVVHANENAARDDGRPDR